MSLCWFRSFVFFFNDTATTEIYTLSLHDALPISHSVIGILRYAIQSAPSRPCRNVAVVVGQEDRKSTRLNSSHSQISYAVFCLKKKKRCDKTGSAIRLPSTGCTYTHCHHVK